MQAAIEQFRRNIQRVRSFGAIYQVLNAQTTEALDLSDILRSEWVMAVSALDQYIHDIVRLGMLEAYQHIRPQTDAFSRFQIPLNATLQAINSPGGYEWLEDQIRMRHSHLSFQRPDNIADAVRLISSVSLWNDVAARLGTTPQYIREQLRLIVNRRNQIAHESDIDSFNFDTRWPIDFHQVNEVVAFIESLGETIYAIVSYFPPPSPTP